MTTARLAALLALVATLGCAEAVRPTDTSRPKPHAGCGTQEQCQQLQEAIEREQRAQASSRAADDVCCCDGSLSPTCTTVRRGCCSHHGGVCECE